MCVCVCVVGVWAEGGQSESRGGSGCPEGHTSDCAAQGGEGSTQ